MKNTLLAIAAIIALFGALNLVHDPMPDEPHIIYTADIPNLQCTLEGACNTQQHQPQE